MGQPIEKPIDTKIEVTKTRELLEIVIPPHGFSMYDLVFMLVWISISLFTLVTSLFPQNWISIKEPIQIIAISSLFICIGIVEVWRILLPSLVTKTLIINDLSISLSSKIMRGRCISYLSTPRKQIKTLRFVPVSYITQTHSGIVAVPSKLIILAGNKQFHLTGDLSLTEIEKEWLADELIQWLGFSPVKNV
jgi:hypothetical protein